MKVCIINGSPRRDGNTEEVLKPFRQKLTELGARVDDIFLKDWRVAPCLECYACQDVQGEYGCVQKDDAEEIFRRIGACDLLVPVSIPSGSTCVLVLRVDGSWIVETG